MRVLQPRDNRVPQAVGALPPVHQDDRGLPRTPVTEPEPDSTVGLYVAHLGLHLIKDMKVSPPACPTAS
jgi:hypothetical protein